MKRLLIQKSIIAGSYVILAVVIEIITFMTMGLGVLPTHFGLDLAMIAMIALVIFIIPNRVVQLILWAVVVGLQAALSVANEALYSMSGTVFSFSMLNLLNEVTGVMDARFVNWWLIAGLLLLCLGSLVGLIVFAKKYVVPKGLYTRNNVIIMLIAFILAECCAGIWYTFTVDSFSVMAETDDRLSIFYDESELYTEQRFTVKAFNEFGSYGYFVVNIGNTIIQKNDYDEVELSEIDEYFENGVMSESVYGDNIYTGAIDGKNIVLIVIESGEWYAINKEYTPTLYSMAEDGIAVTGFHARDKTNCSEALSIMGSYPSNSSLEPANVLDNSMPYALPNILGEGGYTTNYFHANVGSYYSRDEVFGGGYGFENTYFLDNMPLLDGYEDKDGFYDFDKDSEVIKNYIDEFTYSDSDGGPFFTQMMTLISHGKYDDLVSYGNYPFTETPSAPGEVSSGQMTEEEMEQFSEDCEVKGLEDYYRIIDRFPETFVGETAGIDEQYLEEQGSYSEMFLRYKRYQAGIMDLDFGVNMLVKDLEESGELDNTFFMFYADHSAYYDQMNYMIKGIDKDEFYNTDLYSVPCFMWYGGSMDLNVEALDIEGYSDISFEASADTDSGLQSQKITKFCNTFDILPTLLQLCGYSYNLNLYQGISMFSDEESVFVSHESGIFIDGIYFSTIDLYVRGEEGWADYNFNDTYFEGGFGDSELDFLYSVVDYYDKETMLDAMVYNDYFADIDFYGSAKYVTKL